MALSPKEMNEKIIENLKVKTGKNLEAWLKTLELCQFESKKDKIKWLKNEFGLGHYQSASIVDVFITGHGAYDDEKKLVDDLFYGKDSGMRTLFDHISGHILNLGQDVTMNPCKTYVPFSKKRQFAVLKPTKDGLILGLALGEAYKGDLLKARGIGASTRINYMFILKEKEAFNKAVQSTIKAAYQIN